MAQSPEPAKRTSAGRPCRRQGGNAGEVLSGGASDRVDLVRREMETTRFRTVPGTVVQLTTWSYASGLGALILGFRLIGEHWWLFAVLAYLPQGLFGLPLPFLAVAALAMRRWGLLLVQLLCLALVLVPLMGFGLSSPRPGSGPRIRIFTYNVWLGLRGARPLEEAIAREKPDVVLLQVSTRESAEILSRIPQLAGFQIRQSGRFTIASRFPVAEIDAPSWDVASGPFFVRYKLLTSVGPLMVFNCHPLSIRTAVEPLRPRRALIEARLPAGLRENLRLRERQVAAIASSARAARDPVVIAGDLNLPQSSRIFRDYLGDYRDAFSDAGSGFGYTFPGDGHLPWMRIDRILSSRQGMRFTRYEVADCAGSDHCSVTADLAFER